MNRYLFLKKIFKWLIRSAALMIEKLQSQTTLTFYFSHTHTIPLMKKTVACVKQECGESGILVHHSWGYKIM